MQRFLVSIFKTGFLVLSLAASAATAPRDVDRIVAVVDDNVITASELATRLVEVKQQLTEQRIQIPPDDVLRRQLLERMIQDELQLQYAKLTGIRITDQDIERTVQNIARRNQLTVDAVYDTVRRESGLDRAGYHEQLRKQLSIQQLVEREVNSKVSVSDSEISNFLETAAAGGEEYNLSHIFIATPESPSPEQIAAAKTKADTIHRQIKNGEDFARAAITHSQSAEGLTGGSLGWRSAGQLPDLFVGTLKELKPGEVSAVLRGPNGFHILKLNDQRGGSAAETVQQTRARHILIRPSEILSRSEARANLLRLRERIRLGDNFADLARLQSEDTLSASQGGDLGWVTPGQLVPEFERAMNALAPGELSEPVESAFGFHLIQVLERRQAVSDERARATARQQIHARKADQYYEQWIRRLRDEAYVEYLLDDVD
jgi:peptidyl-prolyl cis-trans isomerase SurA